MSIFTLLGSIFDDLIEETGLYSWSREEDELLCYAEDVRSVADENFGIDTDTFTLVFRCANGWKLVAVLDDCEERHEVSELISRHINHSEKLYSELCEKVGDMGYCYAI